MAIQVNVYGCRIFLPNSEVDWRCLLKRTTYHDAKTFQVIYVEQAWKTKPSTKSDKVIAFFRLIFLYYFIHNALTFKLPITKTDIFLAF